MKCLKKIFFFTFIAFCPLFGKSQFLDSLKSFVSHKPRVAFRFDSKTTFISNSGVSIWGLNLGLDFNKKLKSGIGFYFLRSRLHKNQLISREFLSDTTVNSRLFVYYGGIFAEYVFFQNKKWEMSFPLQVGFGNSWYRYDVSGRLYDRDKHFIALYEANISAQYKILWWLGVGAGIGYRLMIVNNKAIEENFNAPIYTIKTKFFFGDIYRKYFPKKKMETEPANE
ncbi:MAG: hypothetical protein A2275_11700 [Bacteroidetes bacterium RIFOXYA12_FULL_35_11]|nr:MAG: hypothetical protein A2X01_09520 [Bacteroidetes bacterium GWF2_35_48]OFY72652.1 MAG: hypothetical protein A2275_11700 [Bacteroidetes bacterium RIFOXYA12_FULL_35_11]OFY96176.1 MAG: hypothetical protein A2309_05245 [Bacteroidetes bacterium RIFOXYB2_FULL_35_7]OFZ00254.1 MAG: hypothetical protein A2491_14810 [Bacteroidetes bacterium RIFOXYC12_FULL_35_7]HBX50160.1 hypothetical protein [Bacteroidales bacterium]